MPIADLPDVRLHYRWDGLPSDNNNASILVLSNSLGTTLDMWRSQLDEFGKRFRVLRYDTRGHGGSSVPPGEYSIEQMGTDIVALLDSLGLQQVNFCGLSLGGMIGMWVASNHPGRIKNLIIVNSAPKVGTADTWNTRIAVARKEGMPVLAKQVVARWFTPEFLARDPQRVEFAERMLRECNPQGYAASCAALRDMDQSATISRIRARTLLIASERDPVCPPSDADAMAAAIQGSERVDIPGSHLSPVEEPEAFTRAVTSFLGRS